MVNARTRELLATIQQFDELLAEPNGIELRSDPANSGPYFAALAEWTRDKHTLPPPDYHAMADRYEGSWHPEAIRRLRAR
jgi:hypothetical protein